MYLVLKCLGTSHLSLVLSSCTSRLVAPSSSSSSTSVAWSPGAAKGNVVIFKLGFDTDSDSDIFCEVEDANSSWDNAIEVDDDDDDDDIDDVPLRSHKAFVLALGT